jgi:hypothetical protein
MKACLAITLCFLTIAMGLLVAAKAKANDRIVEITRTATLTTPPTLPIVMPQLSKAQVQSLDAKKAKDDQPKVDPSIAFSGPTDKPAGRMAIIKVKFTGDDLKLDCTPRNEYWTLVRFFDDSVGVIFDADKEGVYTFVAAANGNGKTAIGMHSITIGTAPPVPPGPGPGPGPGPAPLDNFTKALQAAYAADLAAGVAKSDMRPKLAAAYAQGIIDFIPVSKTNLDLVVMQKKLNEQQIGVGTMPQVRALIAQESLAVLGKEATTALDKAKATQLWQNIANGLNKITP